MAVIVYGPQGCGKTQNSAVIAAHFNCSRVIDGWAPGDSAPEGALVLTNVPGVAGAIPFSSLEFLQGGHYARM